MRLITDYLNELLIISVYKLLLYLGLYKVSNFVYYYYSPSNCQHKQRRKKVACRNRIIAKLNDLGDIAWNPRYCQMKLTRK